MNHSMEAAPQDNSHSTRNELLQKLRLQPEERDSASTGQRRRWVAITMTAALLVVAAKVAASYMGRNDRLGIEAATAIAPAGEVSPSSILQATGYVTARREATVSAQITGTLTEVLIEEGDHVKTGQVLAHLESTAQRAYLNQTRAQFEAAQALLGEYEARLAQARRDLKRNEELVTRQLVSVQALETAQTQVETLQAQLESQSKQTALTQAAVEGAEVQLEYTTVRAPFSGVVIAKAAQTGEIVSPTSAGGGFTRTGIGTIVDMDSLEIEVDVNESYINRVKPGAAAQAVLDAYPDWVIPAHVLAIIPTADRSKATVKVRVEMDRKDARVLPDMGVRVSFLDKPVPSGAAGQRDGGSQKPDTRHVLVPNSSIVTRDGRSVVFIIEADHVHAQWVTHRSSEGDVSLVEGVSAGTPIVHTPPPEMEDGARISVKNR